MPDDATTKEEGKTYTTKESWHTTEDGIKLYAKTWTVSTSNMLTKAECNSTPD